MAISDLITLSTITGQSSFEGFTAVRQWSVHLWEVEPGQHSIARRIEIGHARLFTVPRLDLAALQECEILSGELETVMAVLVEHELQGPVAILDDLQIKPKYRGRGLAQELTQAAFAWFEGLVNLEALNLAARPKFRPTATHIAEKLGFRQLQDEVWIREAP